jgi:hypothetical protein
MPIIPVNDELTRDIKAHNSLLSEQVKIIDNYIVINVAYEYNIPLESCQTAEQMLNWVWHLTEKTWINPDILRRFIELACIQTGVKHR